MTESTINLSAPTGLVNPMKGPTGASTTAAQTRATRVRQAIQTASAQTGVSFNYLLAKAHKESCCDPTAKATSSSATGLFQFVDQTWLRVVKKYGAEHGLVDEAAQITLGANGTARASSPEAKKAILALRNDPALSATMAGELANENRRALRKTVGGSIGSTEMYLAHFLGAGGATTFLKAMKDSPNQTAADLLPSAAAANPSVFYGKDGLPKSVGTIYASLARTFGNDANGLHPAAHKASVQLANASLPSTSIRAGSLRPSTARNIAGHASESTSRSLTGTVFADTLSGTANIQIPATNAALSAPSTSAPFAAMLLAQAAQEGSFALSLLAPSNRGERPAVDATNRTTRRA